MPTLKIINNFSLDADGIVLVGKQGNIADAVTDGYSITDVTIVGNRHPMRMTLATATVVTAYDSSNSPVTAFDYAHFWADVTMYVQLITSATNVTFKVLAKTPFVIPGFGKLLAAANTSLIAGGSEPAVTAIAKVVIGNYSGGAGNYILTLID